LRKVKLQFCCNFIAEVFVGGGLSEAASENVVGQKHSPYRYHYCRYCPQSWGQLIERNFALNNDLNIEGIGDIGAKLRSPQN